MFVPFIVVIPGMIASVTVSAVSPNAKVPDVNNSILYLIQDLLPNGMLGIAIAGLLAAFMAGMAANISAFNTVFSYDIWQQYVTSDHEDDYYTRIGRIATFAATIIAIGTALFASQYTNIMNYLQVLFGFFNAPLFATFILGMFWKKMTPTAGWVGLVTGTVTSVTVAVLSVDALGPMSTGVINLSGQGAAFVAAGVGFILDIAVSIVVSLPGRPKEESQLRDLVYSLTPKADFREEEGSRVPWWQQPTKLASVSLVLVIILNILFW
jgi:SSS family solute:Na+ symporter